MPDITMCTGEECPKKNQCYRFRAVSDQQQYYMSPPSIDGNCEMFYPIEKGMKINPDIGV